MKVSSREYKSKVRQFLETIDFSENIQKIIKAMENLQSEIYECYCNLM